MGTPCQLGFFLVTGNAQCRAAGVGTPQETGLPVSCALQGILQLAVRRPLVWVVATGAGHTPCAVTGLHAISMVSRQSLDSSDSRHWSSDRMAMLSYRPGVCLCAILMTAKTVGRHRVSTVARWLRPHFWPGPTMRQMAG